MQNQSRISRFWTGKFCGNRHSFCPSCGNRGAFILGHSAPVFEGSDFEE
jgi:hypothetical protein